MVTPERYTNKPVVRYIHIQSVLVASTCTVGTTHVLNNEYALYNKLSIHLSVLSWEKIFYCIVGEIVSQAEDIFPLLIVL